MPKSAPTIKEIARKLNISFSTVSRALHDHPSIGLGTKLKVKKLAEELGYEPNQTAVFLQQGKTYTIGVILPHLAESFFPAAISGIEEVAIKNDYVVLLGQSLDSTEREIMLVESMRKHRVDGLIISMAKNTTNYEHFEKLKKSNIPIVFFDCIPSMKEIHTVSCNMISGSIQAVSYLLKKGHRVIGLINGPEKLTASKERLEGYQQALLKNRLKFDPSLVVNSDLTKEGNIKALHEILKNKRKITAIVAFHDNLALDIMQELDITKQEHKPVIVSYANLPMMQFLKYKPNASVEQFPYLQGKKAAEIILDIIKNKNNEQNQNNAFYKIILDSKLIDYH
ncbi:LacI family DNA-binding transcriptional regulator [Hydrotalea sandarakina]|jgi:LacI family transcriptional regulator|uniref:LacI family transcriptional regulator n=1 Tax=Hydrotalea sandarakina TaxID=1004304 RepID=A0A2W7S120_9BACT|nr:LacI family DNA-binding transcriptional regulator [Hydrotalea sandarakina]PZX64666.1 LacI family transcriptional regulator [Hydrotalea sandarakina]